VEKASPEQPRELLAVERKLMELFSLVEQGILGATDALLSGNRDEAKQLVERDRLLDELYHELEEMVMTRIEKLDLPRSRLAELIQIFRMCGEVERSGDLAEHIAWRATRNVGSALTPRIRGIIQQMGQQASSMWRETARGFLYYSEEACERVEDMDDELDELHVSLIAELTSSGVSMAVAIETALVGRFYERLGDHAVNIARRTKELIQASAARGGTRP
jgi:phosphate transport system protein